MLDPVLNDLVVVDLCDHRGEVGPYVLADLGARTVKPVVNLPADDDYTFHAYNSNKHLFGLDPDPSGRSTQILEMVGDADVVVLSAPDGPLSDCGLTIDQLHEANPRLVTVAVTPFGLSGPYTDDAASDLTIGARGGIVRLQGTPDRPPLSFSIPQVWRHAGVEAAAATMTALRLVEQTGLGQRVDVSAQSVVTWTMLNAMEAAGVQGYDFERAGSILQTSLEINILLDALDGYVVATPTARIAGQLVPWLVDEAIVDQSWADIDWATYDGRLIDGEPVEVALEEVVAAIGELCRRKTRHELMWGALKRGATIASVNSLGDLLDFDHLAARSFWSKDGTSRQPGAFYRLNGVRPDVARTPVIVSAESDPDIEPKRPDRRSRRSTTTSTDLSAIADSANDSEPTRPLPFSGLKVVDFSWIGVGPITTKALADHGATVVRVESENRMDGLRRQPPFKDAQFGINRSNFFGSFNTSKLSISLDLKTEAGLSVARRLAAWADVMVESFTPGAIDRLGLSYEEVSASNPSLIMLSTSLLGAGSPMATMAGYGYHAAAVAGFFHLVGWPDRPPAGPWVAYTDTIAPRFATATLMAAIRKRAVTGEGCWIEVAQAEAAIQLLAPELAEFQATRREPQAQGNRHRHLAPQGVYPAKGDDQWVAITVADDHQWTQLCAAMGNPAWSQDERLATEPGRRNHHDMIDDRLSIWTSQFERFELERRLLEAAIPAAVVQTSADLLADPQYRHRDFYRYHHHSEAGEVPYAGHQYLIDGYSSGPRWAAPCLGEHTFEVLADLLGMSSDEIAEVAAGEGLI